MEGKRLSSEIAKLISRLARGHKLPAEWTAGDFVSLVGAYKGLVEAIREPTGKAKQDLDDEMKVGRTGAYEAMVERARMKDKAGKGRK